MTDIPMNVLFLCTGNSARSILGEALLNRFGEGRFHAYSAGSFPKGTPHPMAMRLVTEMGLPTEHYRSKSWDEFSAPDAPKIDIIITVCDNAAGETCPIWPGHPMTVHWGIDDPAAIEGPAQEQAFRTTMHQLKIRIDQLLALPIGELEPSMLKQRLAAIGASEGATDLARRSASTSGTAPVDVVIYHNPACGTSRNTLAMIRNAGIEPHVIEYLKTPPSRAMLEQLMGRAGITPRALLREKGTPYAELGLADESLADAALVDAMMDHPILINRPLVATPLGVRLCRPSEAVLDILPAPQQHAFTKEDGERVIDEAGNRIV